jgi:hypothetical protein
MQRWKLQEYVKGAGRGAITDWNKKLVPGAQAECDAFLKLIVKIKSWELPDFKLLRGYPGLGELRWKSGGVQFRIIGRRIGEYEFLMLIGCTHKQKRYNPADALETANHRFKEISNGQGSYNEYKLPLA